jgi:hypothetical protein
MFAAMHSDFNSLKPRLLDLNGQPNSPKGEVSLYHWPPGVSTIKLFTAVI